MDRNTKIAFGVLVFGIFYSIGRTIQLEQLHNQLVDALVEENDKEFQALVDVKFADIVENFDE